ncbi:Abi family protein [Agromyces archimandritae]|uniref:Abi family protein n=1 Tax=Agromyces archimandritae TaxID=2781962 RepID=A0A975IME6_9MICO|nr:Abi family protein [Agromyces archimandritae]QTX03398.1 Abi family protein [Agromyces archimandritae]
MADYAKPWLSIDEQIDRLSARGVIVTDRARTAELLRTVGYYRLTGYLYPSRSSETFLDEGGRERIRVLNTYREGTTVEAADRLIDFDRELRLLVLDGVERIEIALRTQIGYTVGRLGAFAHQDASAFVAAFDEPRIDTVTGAARASRLEEWLVRVQERRDSSDEAFVAHFRTKYDDQMPIWALTELLELGHLSRLYAGLRNDLATEIAGAFGVPTKRLMESWIATINYVRNIAAHHARLFNRKLVTAPKRPKPALVPLLAHLSESDAPKQFGSYSALAVMAYLLRTIDPDGGWAPRAAEHLRAFPEHAVLDIGSMGVAPGWLEQHLWRI